MSLSRRAAPDCELLSLTRGSSGRYKWRQPGLPGLLMDDKYRSEVRLREEEGISEFAAEIFRRPNSKWRPRDL